MTVQIDAMNRMDLGQKLLRMKRAGLRATTRIKAGHHIFGEKLKQFLLNYPDEVIEHSIQNFSGFNVSRSTIYGFMITQCSLLIKYAQFHPVERNNEEKIQQWHNWVQKW